MIAEELMVGDKVLWQNKIAEVDTLWRGSHASKVTLFNKDRFQDVFLSDIEPIPITPEILKKNGFTIEVYTTLDVGNGQWLEYYHHEKRLRLWWKGIDEWENHSEVTELTFQCHVWYVHELQHALRLCGIEKVINL